MDKLVSRIDPDQITNSTVARWIAFFTVLGNLTMPRRLGGRFSAALEGLN